MRLKYTHCVQFFFYCLVNLPRTVFLFFSPYYSCHQILWRSQVTFTLPYSMVNSNPCFSCSISIHRHRELFLKYFITQDSEEWCLDDFPPHKPVLSFLLGYVQSQNFCVTQSQVTISVILTSCVAFGIVYHWWLPNLYFNFRHFPWALNLHIQPLTHHLHLHIQ